MVIWYNRIVRQKPQIFTIMIISDSLRTCCLHDFFPPVCLSSFSLQDLTSTQNPSISQEAPWVAQTSAPSCDEESVQPVRGTGATGFSLCPSVTVGSEGAGGVTRPSTLFSVNMKVCGRRGKRRSLEETNKNHTQEHTLFSLNH